MIFMRVHQMNKYLDGEPRPVMLMLENRDGDVLTIDNIDSMWKVDQESQEKTPMTLDPKDIYDYFLFMRRRRINCETSTIEEPKNKLYVLQIIPERKSVPQLWINCRKSWFMKGKDV